MVSIDPGGVLNDYIPFYFHYKMPMLYNIWKKDVADTMVPRMRLFIW